MALYLRISEDRSGEEAGIDRQRADGLALAAGRGWPAPAEYVDNDTSAAGHVRRADFERLLQDVAADRISTVIAWDMTRLLRSARDRLKMIELGKQKGTVLAFVRSGDLDLSSPDNRWFADMLGGLAQREIEVKSDRQRRANLQRRQSGQMGWTRRPYGYERDADGTIHVVRSEAKEIRRAAKDLIATGKLAPIVRGMNDRGARTTVGNEWSIKSLRDVLTNPRYIGRVMYNGEDMGPGNWDPILDVDTFDHVRAVLTDPARLKHKGTALKYWLSGLLECGRCEAAGRPGRVYATPYRNHGQEYMIYSCFECRLGRRMDRIDRVVEAIVLGRLAQPDALVLLRPPTDVRELRRAAEELRTRQAGIAGLLAEGLLTAEAARPQLRTLADEISGLEAEIAAASSASPLTALSGAEGNPAALQEVWTGLPVQARRDIAELLMRVTLLPVGTGTRWRDGEEHRHIRVDWKS